MNNPNQLLAQRALSQRRLSQRTLPQRNAPLSRALRRSTIVAAIVALVIAASTLTATPAHAVSGGAVSAGDAAAVEQILRAAGSVREVTPAARRSIAQADSAAQPLVTTELSTASLSLKAGLSVVTGSNTLQVTPVVAALAGTPAASAAARAALSPKALSPAGLAVYANTTNSANATDSAFALSTAATGGNAGYAVIMAASAPTAYRFAFAVDGRPAVLRLASDGGVEVLTATGTLVNTIAPAWAKDATGAALPTSYSVAGNILTQNVTHAGAVYPVVADPRLRCDSLWCTLELTRRETSLLADNALNPGGACAILGPGAGVCAAVLVGGWAQASFARATGQCIGVRVWKANFISYLHLAYVGCYA